MSKHVFDLYHSDIHFTFEIPDAEMALDYFSKSFLAIVDKHAPFKKLRIKVESLIFSWTFNSV